MKCLSCGHQNEADNEFCENCGSAFGITCERCGRINGRNSRFCGRCGTALATSPSAPFNQAAQDLLQALSTKGGERKHLTVLFADIRDSTSLLDSLGDPELGMKRIRP